MDNPTLTPEERYYERLRQKQKAEGTYNPGRNKHLELPETSNKNVIKGTGNFNWYAATHDRFGQYVGLPTIEYEK